MTAEELRHFVAGIEVEVEIGTGTGSAPGTASEVGCIELGIHRWESSYHLDHRKGSVSGHQCSRWRPGRPERLSEGN